MGWLNGGVLDIVVVVPILWRALKGWREGLVMVLYGVIGWLLAAFIGWRLGPTLLRWPVLARRLHAWGRWLQRQALSTHVAATPGAAATDAAWLLRVAASLLIFFVAQAVLQRLIGGFSRAVNHVPLVSGLNRLTGAAAAAASAALIIALLLVIVSDVGVSWHLRQLLTAEQRSGAARALLPVGRSLFAWVLHDVPGAGHLLAHLTHATRA